MGGVRGQLVGSAVPPTGHLRALWTETVRFHQRGSINVDSCGSAGFLSDCVKSFQSDLASSLSFEGKNKSSLSKYEKIALLFIKTDHDIAIVQVTAVK